MLSRGGSRIHSGQRHYYVHYSSDGKPFPSFAVHDQVGDFYLGSWYGMNKKILAKAQINTAIEEISSSRSISIYPVPVNNYLKLEVERGIILNEIAIYDLGGRCVKLFGDLERNGNEYHLEMDGLNTGVYLLKAEYNQRMEIIKFIITE